MNRTTPLADRFWAKVDKTPGHGPWGDCWLWTAAAYQNGYGYIWEGHTGSRIGRRVYAHRVAFLLGNGIDPGDLNVCHSCDSGETWAHL